MTDIPKDATVIEVDLEDRACWCPVTHDIGRKCTIAEIWCEGREAPADCPLRKGPVVVRRKK